LLKSNVFNDASLLPIGGIAGIVFLPRSGRAEQICLKTDQVWNSCFIPHPDSGTDAREKRASEAAFFASFLAAQERRGKYKSDLRPFVLSCLPKKERKKGTRGAYVYLLTIHPKTGTI
jgi:hypothetical protein